MNMSKNYRSNLSGIPLTPSGPGVGDDVTGEAEGLFVGDVVGAAVIGEMLGAKAAV